MFVKLSVSVVLISLILFSSVHSLTFDIDFGKERCIAEDLGSEVVVIGAFSISNSQVSQVFAKVDDPDGTTLWKDMDASTGSFAISTQKPGRYQICFVQMTRRGAQLPPGFLNEKRTVLLDLKVGAEAKDYDEIARKEKLTPLEIELRKLEDVIQQINRKMTLMRGREAQMRNTNESTNNRVLWLSIASLVAMTSLGGFQILYLKRFFQQKKLI